MKRRADCLFFFSLVVYFPQVDLANLSATDVYGIGNINRCLAILGKDLERFEVLPGIGWDNLENRDGGLLVAYNYSKCRTTDDGKFIIPDNVFTVPLKTSYLEIFGEMFLHWSDFTSTTASSINVNAELQKESFGISGSFSAEFEKIKKHQISDKSITTRVQAKYVRYSAKLQPDSELSPSFRQRLKNIAFYIQKNLTKMATYESQILIRDFGTHVLSSIDAGAIVTQIDEVKTSFAKSLDADKSKIIAAASASFQTVFKMQGEFKTSASTNLTKQYEGNRTHSVINAIGGPIFKPHNFTLSDWAAQVKSNLVAVDRLGFPIYDLITMNNLPELPPSILYYVVKHVKNAIEEYYKFNMYRGCTDIDSPNFSYMANVDDGTCSYQGHNFSFGGIYQTCHESLKLNKDFCATLNQKNPLTGNFSCPAGYQSVFLLENAVIASELRQTCTSCGFLYLRTCCSNYHVYSTVSYKAYWCVEQDKSKKHDGFLFGGIFTGTIDNPLTQARECPLYFYPLEFGSDMKVCVSDDFELGFRYSVPFSGFFSCKAGNPLAIGDDIDPSTVDLYSYLKAAPPEEWPRRCPSGYSMHLASVEKDTCEINYCVKTRSFSYKGLPAIRKPPFIEIPTTAFDDGDNSKESYDVDDDRKTWIKITPKVPVDSNASAMIAQYSSASPTFVQVFVYGLCVIVAIVL